MQQNKIIRTIIIVCLNYISNVYISITKNSLPNPKLRQTRALASAEAETSAKWPKLRYIPIFQ